MDRLKILLIAISLIVLLLGYFFRDHLPPRTPLKIARLQSGLDIPNSVQIIEYKEEYSFTGEGFIYVELKFNKEEFDKVFINSHKNGYKKLILKNLILDKLIYSQTKEHGYTVYNLDITKIKNGYYKLNARNLDNLDYGITVIDFQKKHLIVYISIP